MISAEIQAENRQHLDVQFQRAGDFIVWDSGLIVLSYRPENDGVPHQDSCSLLIGPRMRSMYTAIPMVTITGVNFTPGTNVNTSGVTLAGPVPVSVNGFISLAVSGSVAGGEGGSVIGNASGTAGLDGFTSAIPVPATPSISSRPTAWNITNVSAAWDATVNRCRLSVTLNALGDVEISQLAYHVVIFGHNNPISFGGPGGGVMFPTGG